MSYCGASKKEVVESVNVSSISNFILSKNEDDFSFTFIAQDGGRVFVNEPMPKTAFEVFRAAPRVIRLEGAKTSKVAGAGGQYYKVEGDIQIKAVEPEKKDWITFFDPKSMASEMFGHQETCVRDIPLFWVGIVDRYADSEFGKRLEVRFAPNFSLTVWVHSSADFFLCDGNTAKPKRLICEPPENSLTGKTVVMWGARIRKACEVKIGTSGEKGGVFFVETESRTGPFSFFGLEEKITSLANQAKSAEINLAKKARTEKQGTVVFSF